MTGQDRPFDTDEARRLLRRRIAQVIANSPHPINSLDILGQLRTSRMLPRKEPISRLRLERMMLNECHKKDGLFVKLPGSQFELRDRIELRLRIVSRLSNQGFRVGPDGTINRPSMDDKELLRKYHTAARSHKYNIMREFLREKESGLLDFFADGDEIDIGAFSPRLRIVKPNSPYSDLFRYASLLWSVPVSEGFGRRIRFLLIDESNGKLIGLFAVGDPVFNLRCRDEWIGWNSQQRMKRLYNVMDIFVLGAVPPYSNLLCGKLVALTAASNEVRNTVARKYRGTQTIINKEKKDSRLVLLTTGSALGKSSLYDRVKFDGQLVYQRIGASQGWGHFQFNDGMFKDMIDYVSLSNPKLVHSNRFGQGPNWKFRISRMCLESLGLGKILQQHGIAREIYAIPLASNFREFLLDETKTPHYYNRPFDPMVSFFRERWMVGRAERCPDYKGHKRQDVSAAIHSAGKPQES